MNIRYEERGFNNQFLDIYIDEVIWKTVKSKYFLKKIIKILNKENFKEKFLLLEKKKCIDISLYLLAKRSYLKKQWVKKMEERLFPQKLIEEVFQTKLFCYFNEEEELKRQILSYVSQGKGKYWILRKIEPNISVDNTLFINMLNTYCSENISSEKILEIIHSKNLLKIKGREKTIAFFLRRGFSYKEILNSISNCDNS